ncbi:MAG TPA: hypothetical protein VHF44_02050 [Nitrososphaeraceae archaeon]|nr:hypothetical protein [Nitrososphaeraceae archaeon]
MRHELCPGRQFMEDAPSVGLKASLKWFLAIQEKKNSNAINAITSSEWTNCSSLELSPSFREHLVMQLLY